MTRHPHGRLGPYDLESAIGEGGLGEVWKARDTLNARTVALRILPSPPPGDPFRFARFEHDVHKLTALTHPNVAKVYGLVQADAVRALAYEWVSGESLAQRIARGPIPIDEAVRVFAQVANGLAAAHARDVVHGDVKPSNITLCTDGTVKVLDLGLVEIYEPAGSEHGSGRGPASSARLLGVITGTAAYMSPEQVLGGAADSRADVWALGCVLFEMLTGKPAFAADDLTETMALVTGAEPEWTLIPPATPSSLVQMLRRCLDKDATRRFQRLTDVLAPIRATIGEEGAVEAFLRQSALRRLSHAHGAPLSTDDISRELAKQIKVLKRWVHGRLPADEDTGDVVQDVVAQAARRLKGFPPRHRGALAVYLRQSVANRVREVVRRQLRGRIEAHDPDDEGVSDEAMARYRKALDSLGERDRRLVRSRLEDQADYDEIARRFSMSDIEAARMAVSRALRRLVQFLKGKTRE